MSWLSQALVADLMSDGGQLIVNDPVEVLLAASVRGVLQVAHQPLWYVQGLGDGGAVAQSLGDVRFAGSPGPVVAVPPSIPKDSVRRPLQADVLITQASTPHPGFASLAPQCPGLAVAPHVAALGKRIRARAEALTKGHLHVWDMLRSGQGTGCLVPGLTERTSGSFALELDPLALVRSLDRVGAVALAVAGRVDVLHGASLHLRVPTLGLSTISLDLCFAGSVPHRPPGVTVIGAAPALRLSRGMQPEGPVVSITGPTLGAAWIDVDIRGSRLHLHRVACHLPALFPANAAPGFDPLDGYSDPLMAYDDRGPG